MKNKRITFLLVIAVLFIWGWLAYKVYRTMHGNVSGKKIASPTKLNDYTVMPAYTIHLYARDPFLSILTDTAAEPVHEVVTIKHVEKPLVMPQYFGLIESAKRKTAILKLNKNIFFVHEGESFQTFKIKKILTDSVIAISGGNKIAILLNKKKKI